MTEFAGIPDDAFRFYSELEQNNNRDWWLEHKPVYDAAVKEPLTRLLAELEPRFGPAKIFRPNRDVRFSPDKSPYKTAQGAFAALDEGVGFYLQISADGLLIGGGCHTQRRPSWPAFAAPWTTPPAARPCRRSCARSRRRASRWRANA